MRMDNGQSVGPSLTAFLNILLLLHTQQTPYFLFQIICLSFIENRFFL